MKIQFLTNFRIYWMDNKILKIPPYISKVFSEYLQKSLCRDLCLLPYPAVKYYYFNMTMIMIIGTSKAREIVIKVELIELICLLVQEERNWLTDAADWQSDYEYKTNALWVRFVWSCLGIFRVNYVRKLINAFLINSWILSDCTWRKFGRHFRLLW